MATKKTSYSEIADSRLGNTFESVDKQMTKPAEEPAEKKAAAETGKKKNKTLFNFRINENTLDKLRNIAEEKDTSVTEIVKQAIREYLEKEKNKY